MVIELEATVRFEYGVLSCLTMASITIRKLREFPNVNGCSNLPALRIRHIGYLVPQTVTTTQKVSSAIMIIGSGSSSTPESKKGDFVEHSKGQIAGAVMRPIVLLLITMIAWLLFLRR